MASEFSRQLAENHKALLNFHRQTGGTILRSGTSNTRVLEAHAGDGRYFWGADFLPIGRLMGWLLRRQLGDSLDPGLGIAASAPREAWLSIASRTAHASLITTFEYHTDDSQRKPFVKVTGPWRSNTALNELLVADVAGGASALPGRTPRDPSSTELIRLTEGLARLAELSGVALEAAGTELDVSLGAEIANN